MSEYRDAATCEIGFWKPAHGGCPVCGPNGPCRDAEYERLIQQVRSRDQFKRALFRLSVVVLLVGASAALFGCAQ